MTSSNDNMRIWRAVEQTAPSATKKANVNGQAITSIIGQYMFMRATEQFGPYGIGWRCEVANEEYVTGGKIMSGEKGDIHVGDNIMHTMRLRLIYVQDGKEGVAEHVGCTPFVYKSKYGATTDMEAPKKTFTDAVKKCLSMLGFSADVFMGLHDNTDYLDEMREQEAIENAEDREAAEEARKAERIEWLKAKVEAIENAPTLNAATKFHAAAARDADRRKEKQFTLRLQKALETAKERFASTDAQEGAAQ